MGKYGTLRGCFESLIGETNSNYRDCFKIGQYNSYCYLTINELYRTYKAKYRYKGKRT